MSQASLVGVLLGLTAALFGAVLPARADDSLRQVRANGKLVIAVDTTYPPMEYEKGDQLVGFDIDFASSSSAGSHRACARASAAPPGLVQEWGTGASAILCKFLCKGITHPPLAPLPPSFRSTPAFSPAARVACRFLARY